LYKLRISLEQKSRKLEERLTCTPHVSTKIPLPTMEDDDTTPTPSPPPLSDPLQEEEEDTCTLIDEEEEDRRAANDIALLWEKLSSITSSEFDLSQSNSIDDWLSNTFDDVLEDDRFDDEVEMGAAIRRGRGEHYVEVPLRIQLGRRLIRRKMTS
jgi:hypothetical protein